MLWSLDYLPEMWHGVARIGAGIMVSGKPAHDNFSQGSLCLFQFREPRELDSCPVSEPGTGNHKGCPYNRFAGAYFHSNRPCRLPPTPPSTKMTGANRVRRLDSGLRRNDGWRRHTGYFQRNHPCRLAVCTPRDENGCWFRRGHSAAGSGRRWIPAPYRGTG